MTPDFILSAAGTACGLLAGIAVVTACYGISRMNRAFLRAAGKLSRFERERFSRSLSRCAQSFMIAGFSVAGLEAAILGVLTFGGSEVVDGALIALGVSVLPAGWLMLLVIRRIAQLEAFIRQVNER